MKGFIEVTPDGGNIRVLININYIATIGESVIIIDYTTSYGYSNAMEVQESYEEIKELIKKATDENT